MVTLFLTPRSPFARRIRLALRRLNIETREEFVDPFHPSREFLGINPLGLVPVVQGLGPDPVVDSATILEVLEDRYGGIWPAPGSRRTRVRRVSTLAQGVMTAVVSRVLEKLKARCDLETLEDARESVERTLAQLALETIDPDTQAFWDTAVMLDYLDIRMPELDWRARHPVLVPILERALESPDFGATRPPRA